MIVQLEQRVIMIMIRTLIRTMIIKISPVGIHQKIRSNGTVIDAIRTYSKHDIETAINAVRNRSVIKSELSESALILILRDDMINNHCQYS